MKRQYTKPVMETVEVNAESMINNSYKSTSIFLDDEEVQYSGKFSGGTSFDAKSRDDWGDLWEE